jgi:hypothetical protein
LSSFFVMNALSLGKSALVAALAVAAMGCTKQGLCDGDAKDYGDEHQTAGIVVGDMWMSNDIESPWLDFDRGRAFTLWLPHSFDNRALISIEAFVAIDQSPVTDAGLANFAIASGNLATLKYAPSDGVHPPQIYVTNGTCEHYYLRVVATFAPAAGDAGTD